jgi:formylmethanofuran dehydrogenase subunit C
MLGSIESLWNKRIVEILVQKFRDDEDENENEWRLPSRSNFYIQDMIKERLKRLRTIWRKAQCQLKENGQLETEEEWAARMMESISEDMKNTRHLTRRQNVSGEMGSAKPN